MKRGSLLHFASKVSLLPLHPWQQRLINQIEGYHAKAAALGLSREEATKILEERMTESMQSLSYSHEDAFRDANRALLKCRVPDRAPKTSDAEGGARWRLHVNGDVR